MRCEDARAAIGCDETPELREHVDSCMDCQAFESRLLRLNAMLDADPDQEVRPGFDTKFFARLDEEKAEPRRGFLHRFGWLVAGATAATAATAAVFGVVLTRGSDAELGEEDVLLALHMDLMEDFELVRSLDDVEAFELLAEAEGIDDILEQGG